MSKMDLERIAKLWKAAAEAQDAERAQSLLATDITVSPPFLEQPVSGIENVMRVFSVFVLVTKKFEYGRLWTNSNSAVLEFTAEVNGSHLHGLDIINVNGKGQISRFDICARSLNSIQSLAKAANQYLR